MFNLLFNYIYSEIFLFSSFYINMDIDINCNNMNIDTY